MVQWRERRRTVCIPTPLCELFAKVTIRNISCFQTLWQQATAGDTAVSASAKALPMSTAVAKRMNLISISKLWQGLILTAFPYDSIDHPPSSLPADGAASELPPTSGAPLMRH